MHRRTDTQTPVITMHFTSTAPHVNSNEEQAYCYSLRRIAMYSIRCNLMQPMSKKTRQHVLIFPPAYSARDTTVYLFTEAMLYSVLRPCRSVYICVMTQ